MDLSSSSFSDTSFVSRTNLKNNNIDDSLTMFLNHIPSHNKKKHWWKHVYPHYVSKNYYYDDYYSQHDDNFIHNDDVYNGLLVQTLNENDIVLDGESRGINKYTQKYTDKIVYILPMRNLYYLDMLFRKIVDFDFEYVELYKSLSKSLSKNNNAINIFAYNMIDVDFKDRFYEFCYENTFQETNYNNNELSIRTKSNKTNLFEKNLNIDMKCGRTEKHKNIKNSIKLADMEFVHMYIKIIKPFLSMTNNDLLNKLRDDHGKNKFLSFMTHACSSYINLINHEHKFYDN